MAIQDDQDDMSSTDDAGSDDEGGVFDFEGAPDDVEDTPDGGAIVKTGEDDGADAVAEFYSNLLEDPEIYASVSSMVNDFIEKVDQDIQARADHDKKYEEGIRRTGLGDDAPGGASFDGASKVVHPMLTKAAIDYSSRAVKELLPPEGPTKDFIPGKTTPERLEKAKRLVRYMNKQLAIDMPEFRTVLEQTTTQSALGGSQYIGLTYDHKRRKPISRFIPLDKLVLAYSAVDFYSAERRTVIENITEFEYEQRVKDGIYIDGAIVGSLSPDETESEKARKKVEGKDQPAQNLDGEMQMYEISCYLDVEDVGVAPYVLTIEKNSASAVSLVRNWEKDDKTMTAMYWEIEIPFIPWSGPYSVGLSHAIGGLSAAATGALRALLDSAHINNFPGALKLSGTNAGGQSSVVQPTTLQDVRGGVGADDIRKVVMPFPYNPPSEVLFTLLGFLVNEGADVVRTSFDDLAENSANLPVGTTMALIEQGSAVVSAIHARLHQAMMRLLNVLYRINRMYVTDEEIRDDNGELLAFRKDFQGPMDVIPVSDPAIFSEVQRFAQMQAVASRADTHPQIYNQRNVELMILTRLKIPNPENLLAPAPTPQEMNAVNENVAMTLGRPVTAFPEQDHLAHIQVLLDYLLSPVLGMLPMVVPTFIPAALNHLKEHIALWYADRIFQVASKASNTDFTQFMQFKDPETQKEIDKTLAVASGEVTHEAQNAFGQVPQIIMKAQQVLQQMMPQPQMDPNQQAELQDRAQDRAQRLQELQQKLKASMQGKVIDFQGRKAVADSQQQANMQQQAMQDQTSQQNQMSQAQSDLAATAAKTQSAERVAAANIMSKEKMNQEDNETAMAISSAEIAAGHKSNLTTGRGIGREG